MSTQEALAVREISQVGQARRAATRLAERVSFSEEGCGQVALIATELGNNLVKYGRDGTLAIQAIERDGRAFVEMLAIDSGPGIADVQRSLQDGVSTGGTPGTGLGAIRRLSQVFDIHSTVGRGTVVLSQCGAAAAPAASGFEWAAVSTPAPGETVCGDAWAVRDRDGRFDVMVADGLGHGPLAAHASALAVQAFDDGPPSPADFCERAHRALHGSRGAAVAHAAIAPSGQLGYAGVGNISGSIVADGKSRGLASQNGTIGLTSRRILQMNYDLPAEGILVMHSDGLTNRWSLDAYPGLATRHSAVIAGVLFRDCRRGRDDATVVVVKKGRAR